MTDEFYYDDHWCEVEHGGMNFIPLVIIAIILSIFLLPLGIILGIVLLLLYIGDKREKKKDCGVAKMYCQGYSIRDISEHYAIKMSEVRRIIKRGKSQKYIVENT